MKDFSYVVYFEQETEGWVSYCLETNIASQGDTKQEAVEMLKEALELYYEGESGVLMPSINKVETGNFSLSVV